MNEFKKDSSPALPEYQKIFDQSYIGLDMSPEAYSKMMLQVYKESGVFNRLASGESLKVLCTSTSSGIKDSAFLSALESELKKFPRVVESRVYFSDFTIKDGETIISPPAQYDHFHVEAVVFDDLLLPFPENLFAVVQQRLGSLYHAAQRDRESKSASTENEYPNTKKLLKELLSVVETGGFLFFDGKRDLKNDGITSTAELMQYSTKIGFDECTQKILDSAGIKTKVSIVGSRGSSVICIRKE